MTPKELADIKRRVECYVEEIESIGHSVAVLGEQMKELEHDINNMLEVALFDAEAEAESEIPA